MTVFTILYTPQKSCMFWMPAQAVNFAFVPNHFRVIYIGAASFAWVNILCLIKRGQQEKDTKEN